MVERRGRACLHFEPHSVVGLRGEHRVQQLDRDRTVEPDIPAIADLCHAAAPQNAPQFVAAAKYLWRLHTSKLAGLRRRQTIARCWSAAQGWRSAAASR